MYTVRVYRQMRFNLQFQNLRRSEQNDKVKAVDYSKFPRQSIWLCRQSSRCWPNIDGIASHIVRSGKLHTVCGDYYTKIDYICKYNDIGTIYEADCFVKLQSAISTRYKL